jgi:DNA-binding transcriptional LysR family regulator
MVMLNEMLRRRKAKPSPLGETMAPKMDLRGLTWKQLRALAATIERGSVSGAAQNLNVTPPAISIQLKLLEDLVGSPLFHRDAGAPFAPTAVGAELRDMAHDMEKLATRTAERVAALKAGAAGTLVFGAVSTAKYLAPYFVAAFERAFPSIRVTLAVDNRDDIIRGIQRNEFDLAMMGRLPARLSVESVPLGDHPHVLIASPGHRLAQKPIVQIEELLQERFLAREHGSGTRILTERFLERIGGGRTFDIVEMGANETIKQSVMAGLGLAILSAHVCLTELSHRGLIALPFSGLPMMQKWYLVHSADRRPSAAARQFEAFVLENRATLVPKI